MSRTARNRPRPPIAVTGLALIALAATAATTYALTPMPGRARLDPTPLAAHGVSAAGHQSRSATNGDGATSRYFAQFAVAGPEGRDMGWRGAVAGATIGELTILLAPAGKVVDSARPEWPVEGVVFVSGDDPRHAFAADVRGTINWRTKALTLAGEVTVGYLRGAHVEQTADLIGHDLSGDLRVTPATLAAR